MRILIALSALVIAVAPDLVRMVNEERQRKHDAKQRDLDRENALDVAREGK